MTYSTAAPLPAVLLHTYVYSTLLYTKVRKHRGQTLRMYVLFNQPVFCGHYAYLSLFLTVEIMRIRSCAGDLGSLWNSLPAVIHRPEMMQLTPEDLSVPHEDLSVPREDLSVPREDL